MDARLLSFQTSLPPLPGDGEHLLSIHTLTDLAIIRLHAPYVRTSDTARYKSLAAAARIADGSEHAASLGDVDPIFGVGFRCMLPSFNYILPSQPLYSTVARFLIAEMRLRYERFGIDLEAAVEFSRLDTQLGKLMGALAILAAFSPVTGKPQFFCH